MMPSKDNNYNNSNYKKLAQFEAAISVDLSCEPEYFKNLLCVNPNFDVNYRIPENNFTKSIRPDIIDTNLMNILFQMSHRDMFKILLNHTADFTSVSNDGCTIVHESIGNDFGQQLHSLKHSYGSVDDDGFAKIALNAHVDFDIAKNPRNRYGFSHFHIACMMNDEKATEYFLKNNTPVDQAIDKDSSILPGFTALHFAVKYSAYETTKLLLNFGADMNLKDGKGMNAFQVLVEERLRTWPANERSKMKDSLSRFNEIKKYFDNNEKILKLFLKNAIAGNCTLKDDIGFSSLHAACTLQDTSVLEKVLLKNNANINDSVKADSFIWPGYTALHFAAHFSAENFKLLLQKGADMEIRDAKGTTSFDICLLSFNVTDIHTILSCHPTWKNIMFSDRKTKLLDFIGAMIEDTEFDSFVDHITNINMYIPFDSPICAGYTPLHLLVICSEKLPDYNESEDDGYSSIRFESFYPKKMTLYGTRIMKCLSLGASVSIQDAHGSTPLHWAFRLQENSLVSLLLDHHKIFTNPVNEEGLSHLHIACASNNEVVVLKILLNNRSDVNSRTKVAYSFYSGSNRIVVKSGSTSLYFAVACPKITEILLQCDADILTVDDEGFNSLERVLHGRLARNTRRKYDLYYTNEKEKVLELLIQRLTEVLVESEEGPEKLLCCYNLLIPNFLIKMLKIENEKHDKILNKVGLTRLHIACIKNDIETVENLLLQQDINVDAESNLDLPIWSSMTPLSCYLTGRKLREDSSDDFTIAKLLLKHGADVMKKNGTETVVHKAFEILSRRQMSYQLEVPTVNCQEDEALVKLLLNYHKDFSNNPKTVSGLSHLHIACAFNNVDMVEEFLKNGEDVNQKIDYFSLRYGGDTLLHFAAIYRSKETVDLLLKYGADVHSTNSYGSTPLHVAAKIRFQNMNIFKALLNARAAVNAENIIGATPLELLIEYRSFTRDTVDIFFQHGCRSNVINPVTKDGLLAMALSKNQNSKFVYEMFVRAADVKELDKLNRNAIHNVVSLKRPIPDGGNYDPIEDDFIPVEDYTKAIEGLVKLNLDIDQQDQQGKTPLHCASQMQNMTAILALLNNGADFNIKDQTGKTAFEYSVEFSEGTPSHLYDYKELDERIMQIFATHIFKLDLLKLDVDVVNKKLKKHVRKKYLIRVTNAEECREELVKLRRARIKSCPIVLNDFLCETGAVVGLSRISMEKREVVEKFFENKTNYLRRKYPEFTGILMLQYRKALKRVKLISPALASIDVVVGFNVPIVCSDIILTFLDNKTLKNLIIAADNN